MRGRGSRWASTFWSTTLGGTFDLAVVENEGESFQVAMEPKGIDRCGGDDFDLPLYYHCEEIARERLDQPIRLDGRVDLKFLRLCGRRKESLSWQERATCAGCREVAV